MAKDSYLPDAGQVFDLDAVSGGIAPCIAYHLVYVIYIAESADSREQLPLYNNLRRKVMS